MSDSDRPIIIKKIKKGEGHHGGAWKVAYADFVTAMMALFIVLWVLGQDNAVKEAVARYFKNPVGFSNGGKDVLKGSGGKILDLSSSPSTETKAMEREELKKMGEKIMSELAGNPDFSNLMDQIKIEVIDEGLRIEIIDSADVFFEIGTAQMKPKAQNLLQKIGTQLGKIENKIVIEGHTDSRPYNGTNPGYTNFELSSDRANSARKILISFGGLNEKRIDEVRGYADRRLRVANDPFNPLNRRISIIVKFNG